MQLILETEALAIEKDMSTIENIQNEKLTNGVDDLQKNHCNGNKESIGDANVIINEDVNKQAVHEDHSLANAPIDTKLDDKVIDSKNEADDKEEISAINSPKVNDTEIEESQMNGVAETETNSKDVKEEPNISEVKEEEDDDMEYEDDIISIKQEHFEQILDIVDKSTENTLTDTIENIVPENTENVMRKNIENVVTENTETTVMENTENTATENTERKVKENTATEDFEKTLTESSANLAMVTTENIVTENTEETDTKQSEGTETTETLAMVSTENSEMLTMATTEKTEMLAMVTTENTEKLAMVTTEKTEKLAMVTTENTEKLAMATTENIVTENTEDTVTKNTVSTENDTVKSATEEKALENNLLFRLLNSKEITDTKTDVEVEETAKTTELCETPKIVEEESSRKKYKEIETSAEDTIVENTETPKHDSVKLNSNENIDKNSPIELKDDMDVEEVIEITKSNNEQDLVAKEKESAPVNTVINTPICKLSNTLDILSDDEEELPKQEPPKEVDANDKQCINIEDDDDIMLIDEDTNKTETPTPVETDKEEITTNDVKTNSETGEKAVEEADELFAKTEQKESSPSVDIKDTIPDVNVSEKEETKETKTELEKPLLPDNFLKTAKKNLADMTREDLEEFCILKIVESIVDRSNLSEIKNKLKTMAQGIEEYRKKAMMLTKQNRDLQVVLKSVQEEQKKMTPGTPITPLKITRSVGMQVFMEKSGARRKTLAQLVPSANSPAPNNVTNRPNARNTAAQGPRQQKPVGNQPIPVPRLVPANTPTLKTPSSVPVINQTVNKTASPMPNGIKTPSPVPKQAEKRSHNRSSSFTVDLTDDEPPTKINNNRTSPAPPVRVVPSQNLLATPRPAFASSVSSPRKVYIPISGPQSQALRPGQTIMLKTVPPPGIRPRGPVPTVPVRQQGAVRVNRIQAGRHPAPLPDCMKQYQPPNWKALPPAPDLKLSKVENGIVISWKIEGYQEDSYEEIASYQLYAYQETSSPPSTSLWKKIGDVKALPLPMACTLTQFMAGFKYYFAVRAVDIRSRLGPFSLPGSILLLNKL